MENEQSIRTQNYISVLALTMMNVTMIAGIGNDVQQSFYGLSSVTYFAIGAICLFIPTALVTAELATGWALTCLLILWFQTMINFGMGMPSFAATIMFYTPNYDAAVKFAQHPQHEILIMTCFIVLYWILTFIATKGVKAFSNIAKYGVIIGTLLPLVLMIVLTAVWLVEGYKPAILMTPKGLIPKWNGMNTLALAAGVFFSYTGIDMNAAHIKQLRKPEKDFPKAMFISMILAFIIFVVGTVIIAMIVP